VAEVEGCGANTCWYNKGNDRGGDLDGRGLGQRQLLRGVRREVEGRTEIGEDRAGNERNDKVDGLCLLESFPDLTEVNRTQQNVDRKDRNGNRDRGLGREATELHLSIRLRRWGSFRRNRFLKLCSLLLRHCGERLVGHD